MAAAATADPLALTIAVPRVLPPTRGTIVSR
jgi:hypothetical protein